MEDIDGGLHPAVDGQSLDEDEDEDDKPAGFAESMTSLAGRFTLITNYNKPFDEIQQRSTYHQSESADQIRSSLDGTLDENNDCSVT